MCAQIVRPPLCAALILSAELLREEPDHGSSHLLQSARKSATTWRIHRFLAHTPPQGPAAGSWSAKHQINAGCAQRRFACLWRVTPFKASMRLQMVGVHTVAIYDAGSTKESVLKRVPGPGSDTPPYPIVERAADTFGGARSHPQPYHPKSTAHLSVHSMLRAAGPRSIQQFILCARTVSCASEIIAKSHRLRAPNTAKRNFHIVCSGRHSCAGRG